MQNTENTKNTAGRLGRLQWILIIVGVVLVIAITVTVLLVINNWKNDPGPRQVFSSGDYDYVILEDGTAELVGYYGSEIEITLPTSLDGILVSSVGEYAFRGEDFSAVFFPYGYKRVGNGGFAGCTTLSRVVLASTLAEIGASAFEDCSELKILLLPEDMDDSELTETRLPESLNYLGSAAFSGTLISGIRIPGGVKEIAAGTFLDCDRLSSITIPSTCRVLGDYAFSGCVSLKSIVMSYVREIGSFTFSNCTSLSSVAFGKQLSSVGNSVFLGCDSLKSVTVAADNESFTTEGGVLIDKLNKKVLLLPRLAEVESYTVPDYVLHIADGAFGMNTNLTELVLPAGLLTIGENAFQGTESLSRVVMADTPANVSIDFPRGITYVGGLAFDGSAAFSTFNGEFAIIGDGILVKYLPRLEGGVPVKTEYATPVVRPGTVGGIETDRVVGISLTLPESVKSISSAFRSNLELIDIKIGSNVRYIGNFAFFEAKHLESVDLSESGVTHIGDQAFSGCYALSEIALPATLGTVGNEVFFECTALASVELPASLKYIGDYMFADCTALREIIMPSGVAEIGKYAFYQTTALSEVSLPSTLSVIHDYAFAGSGIKSFVLPAGVGAGVGILHQAPMLESITINGSGTVPMAICMGAGKLNTVIINGAYTAIGEDCFYDCARLVSVSVPDTVTEIGAYAFYKCPRLEEIHFGGDLTSIGEYAFASNVRLKSFEFDRTLTVVGEYAFDNCVKLSGVDLSWLTSIGRGAFHGCEGITSANLKSLGYSLADNVFAGCTGLRDIQLNDSITFIGKNALSVTAITEIDLPEGLDYIGNSAFAGCKSLKSVAFNSKLERIEYMAFYLCESLLSIELPESLVFIGSSAFDSCRSLGRVRMGNAVHTIEGAAFRGCTYLNDITLSTGLREVTEEMLSSTAIVDIEIPEGISKIGDSAFYSCSNLETVVLPGGIKSIGSYAFSGCEKIRSVLVRGDKGGYLYKGGVTIDVGNDYLKAGYIRAEEEG